MPPDFKNRYPNMIASEHIYFDSVGCLFRSMSWINYFDRTKLPISIIYSSIEGRLGIEFLLYEELIISTGAKLTVEEYENHLRNRSSFAKLIKKLSPNHEKLQKFTEAVRELDPRIPALNYWSPKELEKMWGILSEYVHWNGAPPRTLLDAGWATKARNRINEIVEPLWEKMNQGFSGLLHPSDMKPQVLGIWTDYQDERISIDSVRTRLKIVKPLLSS